MKFESPHEEVAGTRDEECFREFLAGNKTAFTQAFWENGPRKSAQTKNSEKDAPVVPGFEDTRN